MTTEQKGPDGMSDDRRERRERVLKPARIVFGGGYGTCDCLVRNQSATGALLQIANTLVPNSSFELDIDKSAGARRCTMLWRDETLMAVAFDDAPPTQAVGDSSSVRLADTAPSD